SHGTCAALLGAHCYERTGQSLPKILAIVFGSCLRFDEVPECDLFVLSLVAVVATCRKCQQSRDEEHDLVLWNVEIVRKGQKGGSEIIQRFGKPGDPHRIDLSLSRQQNPCGLHKVVATVAVAGPKRYSTHGIGDVFVETREKAETMFSGKILASADSATHYGYAARFAPEHRIALVYSHRKFALGKLVRSAESPYATPEDRHRMFCWNGYVLAVSTVNDGRNARLLTLARHLRFAEADNARPARHQRLRLQS